MKHTIITVTTALMLSSAAAFAQGVDPSAVTNMTPEQAQAAMDMLKTMPPDQQQQLMQTGVDEMKNLSPDQLAALKAKFDNLSPDQKQKLEQEGAQLYQNATPQTKAAVDQKIQNLSPQQQQQLTTGAGGQ